MNLKLNQENKMAKVIAEKAADMILGKEETPINAKYYKQVLNILI